MPAFAVGVFNAGIYDNPNASGSTRQNLAYGLVARTLPVIGRLSAGGYYGAKRALANAANPRNTNHNSGVMVSWDRGITEISDKLWLGIDYMSGNNANGELGIGGSWAFSKQVTLLVGVQTFNPGYKPSAGIGLFPAANRLSPPSSLSIFPSCPSFNPGADNAPDFLEE